MPCCEPELTLPIGVCAVERYQLVLPPYPGTEQVLEIEGWGE